jgi:transcriptional regulator with XRE-family HTH domain
MSDTVDRSDLDVLERIGQRIAAWRLNKNFTQDQLADAAGLGLRTIQRLESGAAATHLSGFVRVCRVLGLLDHVNALVPEPAPSPIAQLKLGKQRRQRATGKTSVRGASKWTWDDQR